MADRNAFERRTPVERLAIAEEKVKAAHSRLDKFETDVKDDLNGILAIIGEIKTDVKDLLAHKNQGIGRMTVLIGAAGALGGAIVWALEHYLK